MLIIADNRIPDDAKMNLRKQGEIIYLETTGITYESISGHPDIFFFKFNKRLVIAPNLPEKYKLLLKGRKIDFIEGEQPVGEKYPGTAAYNAVLSEKYLIHNFRYTDPTLTTIAQDYDLIHVNQGYTRCSLLSLKDDHFITSDQGIKRVLERHGIDVLYVDPSDIKLPGAKHGFFGGCCGICNETVFITGNLSNFSDGDKVRYYLTNLGYSIEELGDGPLFDGGTLLFLD